MKLTDWQKAGGTSWHFHTVTATVYDLYTVVGKPQMEDNNGEDKVNIEWVCETDGGDVFTIYDWKNYRPLSKHEKVDWHIGAHSPAVAEEAMHELELRLTGLRQLD